MERKVGRVPSIVFEQEDGQHGGNKLLISFQTSQIRKLVNRLGRSFFLSRLFDLEVRPEFASGDVIEKFGSCPDCALKHHAKNKKCFVCNTPTLGIFNTAHEIRKRMAEEGKK